MTLAPVIPGADSRVHPHCNGYVVSMNRSKGVDSEIYHAQCQNSRETAPAASPTNLLMCIAQKLLTNPFLRSQQATVQIAAHGRAATMPTSSYLPPVGN